MPRAKVPPSQRQRAAEACNFCRASKKKCSATVPCSACIRRGCAASCYLTHKPRGSRAPAPTQSAAAQLASAGPRTTPAVPVPQHARDVSAQPPSPVGSADVPPHPSLQRQNHTVPAAAGPPSWSGWASTAPNAARLGNHSLSPTAARHAPHVHTGQSPASIGGHSAAAAYGLASPSSRPDVPASADAVEPSTAVAGPSQHIRPPNGAPTSRPPPLQASSGRANASSSTSTSTSASETISPPIGKAPHPRMLLNLQGERVYIGKAASISFLQVIRDMVAEQMGPSQFSHNEQSDRMLEKSDSTANPKLFVSAAVALDAEQKRLFAQCFQSVTGGLVDVFSASEVDALLMLGPSNDPSNDRPNDPGLQINHYKRATIDLIVAIGAQAHSLESSQTVGQAYARQAQEHALAGMLKDPNVDMVRSLLLLAFYMLGECRRNAAFMYLGVAARAAVALGLHSRASYADLTIPKYQLRLRIWISLSILDMLVSAILGRPAATNALRSDLETNIDEMMHVPDQDTACLVSSYTIVTIIIDIVEKLYSKKALSASRVEEYLEKIEVWSRRLPDTVRRAATTPPATTPADKATIGCIHVACLYYFAVTLATRPILISVLTCGPSVHNPQHQQLSSACLDAAMFLVQTCVDAHRANLFLGNMCIIKALVFAAGLILGFEMFAKREMDFQVEATFRGAQDVLGFLAPQSPQASHYLEILTLLSSTIAKQRETLATQSRSKYVGRLFSISGQSHSSTEASATASVFAVTNGGMSGGVAGAVASTDDNTANTANTATVTANMLPTDAAVNLLAAGRQHDSARPDMEGQPFLGWDSLDMMQWDSFPFFSPPSLELSS